MTKKEYLKDEEEEFEDYDNCQKVYRFGDNQLIKELKGYNEYIRNRNETARLDGIYANAMKKYQSANTEKAYQQAAGVFESIINYKDSEDRKKMCLEKAEECKKRIDEIKKAEELARKEAQAGRILCGFL